MARIRSVILGLLVVALTGGGIWSLVHYAGLQASLLWTAIIGAAAWAIRSSIEQKREHQRLLADRKREHYLQFLEFLAQFIADTGNTDEAANTVPLEELRMWSLRLTLIGSDDVVRAWNTARREIPTDEEAETDQLALFRNWGRLWLAMRKDCGHLDTALTVTDVLASFVNDIEQRRAELDHR